MKNNGLCCCEYVDRKGEQSHIIASFCNCEALDETFDRLITCRSIHLSLCDDIFNTFEDRLRIPWLRGAKKVHFYSFLSLVILSTIICIGSFNRTATIAAYMFLLPLALYICHRWIKKGINSHICSNKDFYVAARNYFYPTWLWLSIILTLYSIFLLIFSTLKITSLESLLLISLCIFSSFCFHNTIVKGQYIIEATDELCVNLEEAVMCNICINRVSKDSTHCKYCNRCFSLRDHHCLWLNVCIYRANHRWFISALFLFCGYLFLHAYLTFTTVCHPRKMNIIIGNILYPSQCPNAYFDFSISICTSIGCYVLMILLYCLPVLIWQIYRISFGKRRPYLVREKYWKPKILWKIGLNWYKFWLC